MVRKHTDSARGPVKEGNRVARGVPHGVVVVVHLEARDDPVPRRLGAAPVAGPPALAGVVVGARRDGHRVARVGAAERRVVVDLHLRRAVGDAHVRDVVVLADVDREVC